MAMLHADDFAFATQEVVSESAISALFTECLGLTPTRIAVSASQGAFHKVYFLSLEDNTDADNPWSGKDVVLRLHKPSIFFDPILLGTACCEVCCIQSQYILEIIPFYSGGR